MPTKVIIITLLALIISACGAEKAKIVAAYDGFAQGTTYHIVTKSDREMDLKGEIDSLLRVVDCSMSLYDSTSLISRLNRAETDSVDPFIAECIAVATRISRESNGAYDITIKPLTSALGFTGDKSQSKPNIDSLLNFVGYEKISVVGNRLVRERSGVQIDLNSIAQGATSDYIARYLEAQGVTEYLVEVGGEIFCRGTNGVGKPWRVGIDRPTEGNFIPGADLQFIIELPEGKGLATSGNYRKFYTDDQGQKVVHTVDPRTGKSVQSNLLSATIVAPDATLADAYGTLCMVVGLDAAKQFLAEHTELEACLVYSDSTGKFQTFITPELQQMIRK